LNSDLNMFSADSSAPGYDNMYDEEYAAELTGATPKSIVRMKDEQPSHGAAEDRQTIVPFKGGVWGAVAMIAAIMSWFLWPAVLGPVAVIAGIIAAVKGRHSLGGWSIVLGAASLIFFLIAAY